MVKRMILFECTSLPWSQSSTTHWEFLWNHGFYSRKSEVEEKWGKWTVSLSIILGPTLLSSHKKHWEHRQSQTTWDQLETKNIGRAHSVQNLVATLHSRKGRHHTRETSQDDHTAENIVHTYFRLESLAHVSTQPECSSRVFYMPYLGEAKVLGKLDLGRQAEVPLNQ